eukprot:760812-Hanusia_phi.AAC.2
MSPQMPPRPTGAEPVRKSARNAQEAAGPKSLDERQRERARLARLAMLVRDPVYPRSSLKAAIRTLDQMMQEAEAEMVQTYGASPWMFRSKTDRQ